MLKISAVLFVSLALVGSLAWLAPSADREPGIPNYQPVPDWLKLPPKGKLGAVTGVAVDSADRVYIFHRGKQPIMVFDRSGKFIRSWGDGLFKTAHGLRIDRQGNIWTTDIGNHLVTKFSPQGKVLKTLGKKDEPGKGPDQFNKPADVAVSPAGAIYVADGYGNSRVVKFSKEGKFIKAWGKRGKGKGEFHLPHSIFLDRKGTVYVGDRENNRVQVFDGDGKLLTIWTKSGAPYGLYLSANQHMLVADGRGNMVRVLDLNGKVLGQWGKKGAEPGEFGMSHWVCMDSRGDVYVAEVNGRRVQKFSSKKP